jgi:Ca-activated chloride channel homolog
MTIRKHHAFAALTLILVFSLGCSAHERFPDSSGRPTHRSSRNLPDWVTKRPDLPGYFVSVGVATEMPSLQEGQQAAVAAAVSEIITYLGIDAELLFDETRTELTTQVTNQITARGAARIASGRAVEMYFEKRRRYVESSPAVVYDVYLLLAIPHAALEEERRRIEQRLQARQALARTILQEGVEARAAGHFDRALRRWLYLISMIEDEGSADLIVKEAESEIVRLVDDFQIRNVDDSLPGSVHVTASLRQEDRLLPLAGFPLQIFLSPGLRRIDHQARTDRHGSVSVEVSNLPSSRGPMMVEAGPDLARLLPTGDPLLHRGSTIVESALARLEEKTVRVLVSETSAVAVASAPRVSSLVPGARNRAERVPAPPWSRREGAPLQGLDPIQIQLLAGQEKVYAPSGRPDQCAAYVLEIRGAQEASLPRLPLNITLVLDRSGSMDERGTLDYLRQAAKQIVENLAPHDVFALVTYADEAEVVRAAGTVADRAVISHMIDMIRASGTTNLSAGLIEGIRQAETYHEMGEVVTRVILVSDGLANRGVTDPSLLAQYAVRAAERGITLTTVGLGNRFDEDLLLSLADAGFGNYHYVQDADQIPTVLATEMGGVATVLAQNVVVSLVLGQDVKFVNSLGIPFHQVGQEIDFRVGQVSAGERVRVAFQLELPPESPGRAHFGEVNVVYDSALDPTEPTRWDFALQATYTDDAQEASAAANEYVNRFVHILAIMDSMLLAKKSGSQSAIYEVIRFLDGELPRLRGLLGERDDPEMTWLLEMLAHCHMILREELRRPSGSGAEGDVSKEIAYKLYRLRHHPVLEADRR